VKRGIVVVVIAAAVGLAVWWARRGGGSEAITGELADDAAPAPAALVRSGVRAADAPPPAWFARAGARPRAIAGTVTFEGKPVRASVALHSLLTTSGIAAPVVVTTGDDGVFDFGVRPPAGYQVVASADGLASAIARLDTSDPTEKPPSDRLELRLVACAVTVSGTVYDSSGGVIGGARVRREGLAGVDTTVGGRYRLCLPRGRATLEYSADGYGGVILTVVAQGELQQDVVLVPEGIVTVTALRASDDRPVGDALIVVEPNEWGLERRAPRAALTGADGKARITGLTPGSYFVRARARGMASEGAVEVVAEVGSTPDVVVRLVDTARISGRVVRGKEPIAGATVQAARTSPVQRSSPAVSQQDGSFVLDDVPVGELVLTASPYEVTSPTTFHAEARAYEDVELRVEQLGKIYGVVTRLGKPVAGAEVCCVTTANGRRPATTGDDGSYELLGVAAGPQELLAGYFDDAFVLPTKLTLGRGEIRRLDFELDQAGTITGTVVDKEGKPVPGVFVSWVHEKTGDQGRGTTDAQGRYRCGAMTGGGTYRASVSPAAASQRPFPTADGGPYPALVVKDGRTVIENVELAVDVRKLVIAGRVVDGNGAGIPDAQVRATLAAGEQVLFPTWQKLPSTFTDADGNFTLGDLTAGAYALQARPTDGGLGVLANVQAGATGVTIAVQRPAAIEGTLVGFGAAPVVYAVPLTGDRFVAGVVDGARFRVRGLAPGRYLVSAQTTFEGDGKVVEVTAGKLTPLTLTSRGRAAIEVTLLDFKSGGPLAGGVCHAVIAADGIVGVTNWDPAGLARSDDAGHVVLDPAPAGSLTVECMLNTQKWSMPSADVVVDAGARAKVTLYGVELASENPSDPGVELDRHRTAPVIARVRPGSSAAKAGVLPGDLVTSVDGVAVGKLNASGVDILLRSHDGGAAIVLGVQRGATAKTLSFVAIQ